MTVRRTAAALATALALLATGCASSDGADDGASDERTDAGATSTTSTSDDATPTTGSAPPPEQYSGDDEGFYVVPDPLPPGRPGELIRVQDLGEADGRRSLRIMYHSRDAQDRDRAVTGVLTHPTTPAPDGGRPVISTAHGTAGMAPHCAPSRTSTAAPGWGVDGVWVMSDFIGLGPVGEIHPYLSKTAEGHAVIDAVRAARHLPAAGAGDRWLAVGHSQGGHGAMAAAELAARHAPELDLLGTVALAPGAVFDRVYGGIDPIVTDILTMMGLYGAAAEHPGIDVTDYVTPEAHEASTVFGTGCLDDITSALIPVAVAGMFAADPRETEPARSVIEGNDVGRVAVDGVPLYVASGTTDDRVVVERVHELFDRLCAAGQVTELQIVDGADHGGILDAVGARVTAFLEERLAGADPVDSCSGSTAR